MFIGIYTYSKANRWCREWSGDSGAWQLI